MDKLDYTILKLIDQSSGRISSAELAAQLKPCGFDLSERAVRYHVRDLETAGYVHPPVRRARALTAKGAHELCAASVSERIGCIMSKISNLAFLTGLSAETGQGTVVLNVCQLPEAQLPAALGALHEVLDSPYALSNRVMVRRGGERLDGMCVPAGMAAIGTLCRVTLDGVLLKAGIPVTSRFGGTVEVRSGFARRFASFIGYATSSVSPLEAFARCGMTDIHRVLASGNGTVLGSLVEIPEICLGKARSLLAQLQRSGIAGSVVLGSPSQPLLDMPVSAGKVGVAILCDLNPLAVLCEAGFDVQLHSMGAVVEYCALETSAATACAPHFGARTAARFDVPQVRKQVTC